jgi:aminomethyltransferase
MRNFATIQRKLRSINAGSTMIDVALFETPLTESHRALGAKLVPFAGWTMPVLYSGVIEEHHAVRSGVGAFDVSHMGEIAVRGPDSEAFLEYCTCNEVAKLRDGKAHYNALLNERGGVIDDIIIYRGSSEDYFLCVNASNTSVVSTWLHKCHSTLTPTLKVDIVNESSQWGQIAVQGPRAWEVLTAWCPEASCLAYFEWGDFILPSGLKVRVARTGYTGEDGFECFLSADDTAQVWHDLLRRFKVVPCGLGARDSLRLEAAYPLHGHELSPDVTAIESGLSWIVKFSKGDFIGKDALLKKKEAPERDVLFGVEVHRGIAREGSSVFYAEKGSDISRISSELPVGIVTSGTLTPTVKKSIALVRGSHTLYDRVASGGGDFFVSVRGKNLATALAPLPFYSRLKRGKV